MSIFYLEEKLKLTSIIRNSQEMSTYTCSRMIFVSRFFEVLQEIFRKSARIASAEERSRNTATW